MRVLALQDETKNEYVAFTVDDVQYDDDSKGIGLRTLVGNYYYIPNVSLQDFNYVCQKLVIQGYCDVTNFGEICEN